MFLLSALRPKVVPCATLNASHVMQSKKGRLGAKHHVVRQHMLPLFCVRRMDVLRVKCRFLVLFIALHLLRITSNKRILTRSTCFEKIAHVASCAYH